MSSSTPRTPRPSHGRDRTPGDRTQHLDCPCFADASVTLAFPLGRCTGVPWTCLTPTHGPRALQPWTLALTLPAKDQDRAFYGRSLHGHACTRTQAPQWLGMYPAATTIGHCHSCSQPHHPKSPSLASPRRSWTHATSRGLMHVHLHVVTHGRASA